MNDYLLRILIKEREDQLRVAVRGIRLRPARNALGLWRWKAAIDKRIQTLSFRKNIVDTIPISGWEKN